MFIIRNRILLILVILLRILYISVLVYWLIWSLRLYEALLLVIKAFTWTFLWFKFAWGIWLTRETTIWIGTKILIRFRCHKLIYIVLILIYYLTLYYKITASIEILRLMRWNLFKSLYSFLSRLYSLESLRFGIFLFLVRL